MDPKQKQQPGAWGYQVSASTAKKLAEAYRRDLAEFMAEKRKMMEWIDTQALKRRAFPPSLVFERPWENPALPSRTPFTRLKGSSSGSSPAQPNSAASSITLTGGDLESK
ncbi:hypothetical protein NLG97_g6073 [Lecanicillium saksenae]|uniref:Uncharacterized protein n=1 Tax=Lecanicillium saksenae TaxID=468837 RepID=A0ACC1QQT9_9HYPO|nr:hypothetical protein NLG97_g6073 [Lecanicillium saksenae]